MNNMNTTKYLSLAALALMGTLTSCQSNDEAATNSFARPDNAVGINVSVGSLQTTRSNPAANDPDEAHRFNLGDQISVSANDQEAVLFQCQDADQQTWAEAEAGKFLLWTQNEMTFKAYYPATTGTSMTAFTLPADQSTEANIALADYMTRQQTCTNVSGNNINLQLERKTARVIVRINGFNDQYRDDQKTVDNVRIYSEASGIEEGNPSGSSTEIQPYAQGNGGQGSTYTALVVPGSGDSGARFIKLSDGEGNTLEVKDIPELEAGNSYTFNLTVGKNTIQVQSVTVQDWATGTTLAGGQAQEQEAVVHKAGDVESVKIGDYDCAKLYTSETTGFYIMCTDYAKVNWATAVSYSVSAGGNTFTCGTKEEWEAITTACGGAGYNCINTKCSGVTGWTNISSYTYSSTEFQGNGIWYLGATQFYTYTNKNPSLNVRLIAAFSAE